MLRALAKDPAQRFADADAFIAALEAARRGSRHGHAAAAEDTAAFAAPCRVAAAHRRRGRARSGRRAGAGWLVALVVVLLVARRGWSPRASLTPPRQVPVPDVVGSRLAAAQRARAERRASTPNVERTNSDDARGRGDRPGPAAGDAGREGLDRHAHGLRRAGARRGARRVGERARRRRKAARRDAGFKVDERAARPRDTVKPDRVIDDRAGGRHAARAWARPSTLVVSSGPEQVAVPNVVGQTERPARSTLEDAGLQVGVQRAGGQTPTTRARCSPRRPAARHAGRQGLDASRSPSPRSRRRSTVPDVTGEQPERGEQHAVDAGLQGRTWRRGRSRDQAEDGIVLRQSPAAGGKAKRGSTVTITVGQYFDPAAQIPQPDDPDDARDADHTARHHPRHTVRVAVLSGGRSSEHDVSLRSAASVRAGLAEAGHEVVDVALGARRHAGRTTARRWQLRAGRGLLRADCAVPGAARPVRRGRDGPGPARAARRPLRRRRRAGLRAVHGQGRLQGPHGAAPGCRRSTTGRSREGDDARRCSRRSGCRCFVKPARLGSSVGIAKVGEPGELDGALRDAFAHDPRVIVEAMSRGHRGRVLGARQPTARDRLAARARSCSPRATPAGTTTRRSTRRAAWSSSSRRGSRTAARERVRALAVEAFRLAGCSGLARADFFVEGDDVLSTSSTRCPASRRRASTRSSGRPPGCRTRSCSTASCAIALERHEARARATASERRAAQRSRRARPR